MDNCCKPGIDIHPTLGIVFEGFPLKLQRSWGWRSNTTSISFQKISHWMLGCLLKHFNNVICLMFKYRSRTIDIHILYLNGFKDWYGWTITCVIAWAKVARMMKHLLWLWNMAKWSRKWKNRESAIHILFLPETGLPNDWHYQRQKEIAKIVSPKLWLLNALSPLRETRDPFSPPWRDLYVSSRTFRSPRHGGFAWCEGTGTNPWGTHSLLGQKTVEKQAFTWRIIPVSKQLATMVSKSPNWGCSPSKWPFHSLKLGAIDNLLNGMILQV